MNDDFLKIRLQRVVRRYQWLAYWRKLAACWAAAALAGVLVGWAQTAFGSASPLALPIVLAVAVGAAVAITMLHFLKAPDLRWIARKIESRHPELNGVLLTAVQQQLDRSREPGYLQYRVLQEATARSQEQDWRDVVPARRLLIGQVVHLVALVCLVLALGNLRVGSIHGETPNWIGADGLSVSPGDATIERGDSLVVLARFGGSPPPNVSLVVRESGAAPRSLPLVKSLADPVFGGSVTEVANDFTYHLEYRGKSTREFKVSVFEHPKLVRSDVDLTFPDYTKLPPKHIEDTRRVSAVEGTKLDFALQLNKPVKSAKLVARDKKSEIPLTVAPDKPVATLPAFVPAKTQSYDLQLVDAEGRTNKVASSFVIDVQANRPPELRLASPRGDIRPSALEEVGFDGTVFDDFGSPAYGIAYSIAGGDTRFIELGKDTSAKEKRGFAHLLKLEELGAKPDDLVAWYAWADDIGPDGKVRRTSGDLYFGEVRPFDEIFRENQDMESGDDGGGGGGEGNQTRRLTEIQKQIINATWRLQRDGATPKYAEDAKVVRDSQEQALGQAREAAGEARSPRQQAMWRAVTQEMEKAVDKLKDAAKEPGPLAQALPAEQAAYQALLKLQARETAVTRRNRQRGGGGGGEANQRQIDQLDLQQSESRYETQRQARAPQNRERREQLAVMNRLQELARRQQDLNERLKELQTALQEAQTEQQREEIRRRLKRLEEEQRQMLADADEMRQRMDRAENQSSMTQQRQQLEQTREDLQRAADAAGDGSVAQALAAGTRAQRQLQEMRDDLRKQNSSQFAEDLRDMRNEARELSRQQEEIGQKLDALSKGEGQQRKSLSDSGDRQKMVDQLAEQRERLNKLVEKATQISEQAENTEPLLSRQLYDSVRKVTQDDANQAKQARSDLMNSGRITRDLYDRLQRSVDGEQGGKMVDFTREMVRENNLPQARRANQGARSEIDELRKGVERAAESVLGDDTEQLKLAQSELDMLTDQLRREMTQAGGGQREGQEAGGQEPGARDGARTAGEPREPGAGQPGERGEARTAGESREPGAGQPGDRQRLAGEPGERGTEAGREPGEGGRAEQQAQNERPRPGQGEGGREGQRPGERGDRSQLAESNPTNQRPGESGRQPGGEQPGGQQGRGEQPGGSSSSSQTAQSTSPGNQPGGRGQSNLDGTPRDGQRAQDQVADARNGRNQPGRNQRGGGGGNERGGFNLDDIFNVGNDRAGGLGGWEGGRVDVGPLTGEDFARWNDRLRDVEDLVETPEMRNALAAARERARTLRRDFRQDQKKPDWTVVQLEIVKPLVEVRNRVAEELSRRDSKDSLAPIDRDPVPNRFAESVRRYYEELGRDK